MSVTLQAAVSLELYTCSSGNYEYELPIGEATAVSLKNTHTECWSGSVTATSNIASRPEDVMVTFDFGKGQTCTTTVRKRTCSYHEGGQSRHAFINSLRVVPCSSATPAPSPVASTSPHVARTTPEPPPPEPSPARTSPEPPPPEPSPERTSAEPS